MKHKQSTKDAFIKAQKERKKVLVTYFSGISNLFLTKLCIPMQIQMVELNSSKTELFYFWDEQAEDKEQIFSLPLLEIKYLELSDEIYNPENYVVPDSSRV